MTERYSYVEKWSRGYKELLGPLTEEEARARHDKGGWYTVLVDSTVTPSCFIEVVGENGYVGVNFLDGHLRSYLVYAFQQSEPGKLFNSVGTFRTFVGDSDEVATVETYRFGREGKVTVERRDLQTDVVEVGSREIDVTPNFEGWPEFGQYERLLIVERDVKHS